MWVRNALLPALSGLWSLDRTIESSISGEPMAVMRGTAVFTLQSSNAASYSESLVLALQDGPAMPATRQYFYRQDANVLAIFFDEARERPFHRLVLQETVGGMLLASAVHHCAPDHYDSRYEFRSDGAFAITHLVSGPRKSYVSKTLYVRGAS